MADTADQIREKIKTQLDRAKAHETLFESEAGRLSGWLILGNTGALVLFYQAQVGRMICDAGLLEDMGCCFFTGLIAAIVAVALGLVLRWFSWDHHWQMFGALEEKLEATIKVDATKIADAETKYNRVYNSIFWTIRAGCLVAVLALQAGSALAFALGTTAPLRDGSVEFCALPTGAPPAIDPIGPAPDGDETITPPSDPPDSPRLPEASCDPADESPTRPCRK